MAASNGTNINIPTVSDSTLEMVIDFQTTPIDSYSLYAGTTFQAQISIGELIRGHKIVNQDPSVIAQTDFCTATTGPGCVHLHVAPLTPQLPLSLEDVESIVTQVRTMAYDGTWANEALFNVARENKAIGAGWVATQPMANMTVSGVSGKIRRGIGFAA